MFNLDSRLAISRYDFCQALAEALKVNSSIANIGLAANSIGDEGAKAWRVWFGAEHLPTCKTAQKMPGLRRLRSRVGGFWAPKS